MNLTDDFILKCQKVSIIFLDDICAIKCATLGEIVDVGYSNFLNYLNILTAQKPVFNDENNKELNDILNELNDFSYFLIMTQMDEEINRKAKEAFKFFTKEEVMFSLEPAEIIVGPLDEKHFILEEDFYNFRHMLKKMYFLEDEEDDIIIYDYDSPRVKALKRQRIENRAKLAKAKAKKRQQSPEDNLEFSDLIGSIAVSGMCNLNMSNIWNITYYAFQDQLKRMGWHERFNINNRAALAGAKIDKSELKYWIKSIKSKR